MLNTTPFVDKMVARLTRVSSNTKTIEDPELVLQSFSMATPIYEDYGQFAGGMCTLVYEYTGNVYEFILDPEDNIVEATKYPVSVSRFHTTNGIKNDQLL